MNNNKQQTNNNNNNNNNNKYNNNINNDNTNDSIIVKVSIRNTDTGKELISYLGVKDLTFLQKYDRIVKKKGIQSICRRTGLTPQELLEQGYTKIKVKVIPRERK